MSIFFIILTGCALGQGLVNAPQKVSDLSNASEIIIKRVDSFIGAAQTITFTLDGQEIYKFRTGNQYSFKIDPREYLFGVKCAGGWQMWGNVSELAVEIKPKNTYMFRIIPDMSLGCRIERSSE
jgi:hypothetical protein